MKIQIIGGTRYIGPFLVKQLVSLGHEVSIFHRGQTTTILPREVQSIIGDRNNLGDYRHKFKAFSPDIVIDMFPYFRKDGELLMKVFRGIATRVVVLSSFDVYKAYGRLIECEPGPLEPVPLYETSPLREHLYPFHHFMKETDHFYYYDKMLIENSIMNDPDLPGTILRLPQVYGPGDGKYNRTFPYVKRILDGRKVILLGDKLANFKVSRSYVEDVAHAIVLASTNDISKGKFYNVSDQYALNETEWIKEITDVMKADIEVAIVPEEKMPADGNLEQHWYMDSNKIREELGYTEIFSRKEALRRTIDWQIDNLPTSYNENEFDYNKEDLILSNYK